MSRTFKATFMITKKDIRPVLNLNANSENERFQNQILRPILKLQHSLIILLFKAWATKYKIQLIEITEDKLSSILEISLSKNTAIKNQFLGLVIGQFTSDEFGLYQVNASEYNKRIFNMIKQRISDSLDEIKK